MGFFSFSHRKFLTPVSQSSFVMKRLKRKWMYQRLDDHKKIRRKFVEGVGKFIEYAKQREEFICSNKIRCPCRKCKNLRFLDVDIVKDHLYSKGFCPRYYNWTPHGEGTFVSKKGQRKHQKKDVKKDKFGGLNKRRAAEIDIDAAAKRVASECHRLSEETSEASWDTSCSSDASYLPSYSLETQTHLNDEAYLEKRVEDESRRLLNEAKKTKRELRVTLSQSLEIVIEEALNFQDKASEFWDVIAKDLDEIKGVQEDMLSRWDQILQPMFPNNCNNNVTLQFRDPQQPSNGGESGGGGGSGSGSGGGGGSSRGDI